VKIEGTFILRYRVFDIFSQSYGISDLVIQAECYGGTFRVYSTKEFPGLQASTELTKVRSIHPQTRVYFPLLICIFPRLLATRTMGCSSQHTRDGTQTQEER
jgi:hypothetical protein